MQSCDKKAIVPEDENGMIKQEVVNADKKADLLTTDDINWILSNPDKEDMNVDKNLYYLGIALTEIVKNKSFVQNIEEGLKKSNLGFYAFDDLITQKSKVEKIINSKLINADLSSFNQKKEKLDYVTISNSFRYMGTKYFPVINIMNLNIADFSLIPIISPGIEVKDIPEKGIENAVIAWKLNDKNEWERFLLTEEFALKSKAPVLVISFNTQEEIDYNKNAKIPPFINSKDESKGGVSSYSNKFQINYRYERSGNSEYYVTYLTLAPNGIVSPWPQTITKIASVNKNDIGVELSASKFVAYDRTGYKTIFNTWERDGYASKKNLGSFTPGVMMAGRMKYSNEWYAFEPTTNTSNNSWNFVTGYQYRYSKGHIKLYGTWLN